MTPEAQRIAIAEACPDTFEVVDFNGKPMARWKDGPTNLAVDVLGDLNAMHEAWKTLTKEQQHQFDVELRRIVAKQNRKPPYSVRRCLITNATAAQRREAFLRTLNLWKP